MRAIGGSVQVVVSLLKAVEIHCLRPPGGVLKVRMGVRWIEEGRTEGMEMKAKDMQWVCRLLRWCLG